MSQEIIGRAEDKEKGRELVVGFAVKIHTFINVTIFYRHSLWHSKTITTPTSKITDRDFPGGAVVKNLPANAGDTG